MLTAHLRPSPASAQAAAAAPGATPAAAPAAALRPPAAAQFGAPYSGAAPAYGGGGGLAGGYQPRPAPAALPAAEWTEHKAPDGRSYYFNARLNKSSWVRPEGLPPPPAAAPPSAAAIDAEWKEFTAPDGRKYYYNRLTKESKWIKPEAMSHSTSGTPAPAGAAAPAAAAPAATAAPAQVVRLADRPGGGPAAPAVAGHVVPPGALQPGPTPAYATTAEARDAFKAMLADACIPVSLSWDETLRAVVSPLQETTH